MHVNAMFSAATPRGEVEGHDQSEYLTTEWEASLREDDNTAALCFYPQFKT